MMYWDVPFVNQLKYGFGKQGDHYGCWYACISMVGFAFGEGPRLGIPELFTRKIKSNYGGEYLGHYPIDMGPDSREKDAIKHVETLMKNEQLSKMMAPKTWCDSAGKIASILLKFGPLIVAKRNPPGRSGRRFSHSSVLVGVKDSETVLVHEPHETPSRSYRISEYFHDAKTYDYPIFRKHANMKLLKWKWKGNSKIVKYEPVDFIEFE